MIARSTDGRSGEAPRPLGHDRRRRDPQPSRLKERQRAFDAIDRCLDLGDPHRPSVVLFEADPGLGKSALLNAAATSAAHAGWSVHVARTAGFQSGVALAARVSDTLASAA
ncbi:MAG: ATPase domain, partial [Actinomycetota bacterium]